MIDTMALLRPLTIKGQLNRLALCVCERYISLDAGGSRQASGNSRDGDDDDEKEEEEEEDEEEGEAGGGGNGDGVEIKLKERGNGDLTRWIVAEKTSLLKICASSPTNTIMAATATGFLSTQSRLN